jgi:hypothetical protein
MVPRILQATMPSLTGSASKGRGRRPADYLASLESHAVRPRDHRRSPVVVAGRWAPFRHSMGVIGSVMQMRRSYATIAGAENAGLHAVECSGTTPGLDRAQKGSEK